MFNNHLPINHLRASNYLRAYYLRAYKEPLHLSRNLYKSALFMQNKPNLFKAEMDVSSVKTKDYENKFDCKLCENKANSKPIKANLPDEQMSSSSFSTKDYENHPLRPLGENKPNQTRSRRNSNPYRHLWDRVAQAIRPFLVVAGRCYEPQPEKDAKYVNLGSFNLTFDMYMVK